MSRSGIDVELTSDKCLLDPVLRYVRSQGVLSLSMSEGGGGRVRESGGGGDADPVFAGGSAVR